MPTTAIRAVAGLMALISFTFILSWAALATVMTSRVDEEFDTKDVLVLSVLGLSYSKLSSGSEYEATENGYTWLENLLNPSKGSKMHLLILLVGMCIFIAFRRRRDWVNSVSSTWRSPTKRAQRWPIMADEDLNGPSIPLAPIPGNRNPLAYGTIQTTIRGDERSM
ncbi:hypothetical protein DL96DRAFT_1599642 [Flagelloscypha sp. PMI_526]|nr:hypothetical protein DL96DRAFT_1599642 [Flagelloscypha sp. PMI_526]